MSERGSGWGEAVETKPVASTVIPTPQALVSREREARRPYREQGENPILRRLSPGRSYWPDVAAYDERARELQRRVAALNDEITDREQALVQAGEADHEALTRWQLEDGKGTRPEPTAPAIEREIAAKKADRDAAVAATERVYTDKENYVRKHRSRLVREADKATREARQRYEQAIEEAEQARNDLVAAREASLWASFFPGELMIHRPDMAAIATSLRKPVEAALQVKTRLAADGVFRVLRSDAEILETSMTRDQALELGIARPDETTVATWQTGKTDFIGPQFPAAWVGSDEEKAIAERVRKYSEQLGRRLRGE